MRVTVDRIGDLTFLVESAGNLYLVYSQLLRVYFYAIVIGEIDDICEGSNKPLVSFKREVYSTIMFDVNPEGPLSTLEFINEYIVDGLDMNDPIELVMALGGISNNTALPCPKR